MKLRSGAQMPERSGLPSDVRGVGPAGTFAADSAARAVPPPAGSVGPCAREARAKKPRPIDNRPQVDNLPYRLRRARRTLNVVDILVVFLADVLHQIRSGHQARCELNLERLGVIRRILDQRLDFELAQTGARVPLQSMQLLTVRMSAEIEPELVVEADRIDHQRIAFIVADGVSVPGGIGIGGMLSAVQEDLPKTV